MFAFRLIKLILVGAFAFISMGISSYVNAVQSNLDDPNQLLDRIYAVHATRILPASDYLRAGLMADDSGSTQSALWPDVRKTLHFALGEVVRPVEEMINWEGCPYALVTPLRTLLPQLININCYDTFIFGDLQLGPDTYLVVPMEIATKIDSKASIIAYDPQRQSLREAVDEFIAAMDGWHIEMNSEDIEDELHEAYFEGVNINTPEFFASLKEIRPCLSVGLRFDPLEGDHYRLSQIEWPLLFFAMSLFSYGEGENAFGNIESNALECNLQYLEENFAIWSNSLVGFQWCPESLKAYNELSMTVKNWALLMREELRIRECYGKTLSCAPKDFLAECILLIGSQEELRHFIDQNVGLLPDYVCEEMFTCAA